PRGSDRRGRPGRGHRALAYQRRRPGDRRDQRAVQPARLIAPDPLRAPLSGPAAGSPPRARARARPRSLARRAAMAVATTVEDVDRGPLIKPEPPPQNRRNLWVTLVRYRWLFLLLAPGVVYFALFRFWPMYGAQIAFRNYIPFLGIEGSDWVGWDHFENFFTNPDFPRLLGNTLILAALSLFIAFPITIVLALLLNEVPQQVFKRTVQTLVYIPHFLSWTVVVSMTGLLLAVGNGPLWTLLNDVFGSDTNYLAN